MKLRNYAGIVSASSVGLLLSSQSQAAVDAAVTTAITTAGTDVATIGAAMLGLAVIAMTYKWLKAAFF